MIKRQSLTLFQSFLLVFLLTSQPLLAQTPSEGDADDLRFSADKGTLPTAFKDLLPYVVPAPNQRYAGSCLYMATTGAMEVILSKQAGVENPAIDGPTDLSETTPYSASSGNLWKTWYEGPFLKFQKGGFLAKDIPYNHLRFWKTGIPRGLTRTPLPFEIETKRLFNASGSTKNARMRFGVLDESHVNMVKEALANNESPVVVIYRDIGQKRQNSTWDVWHTVVIVGYDDEEKEPGEGTCPWVQRSLKAMGSSGRNILNNAMKKGGGCREKGAFYVRDSESSEEGHGRVPRYDIRSYDWLKYLGNHGYATIVNEKG